MELKACRKFRRILDCSQEEVPHSVQDFKVPPSQHGSAQHLARKHWQDPNHDFILLINLKIKSHNIFLVWIKICAHNLLMFLTRLILLQCLSITMETHKRILEPFTFRNWVCDWGTTNDESIIENAGEGL